MARLLPAVASFVLPVITTPPEGVTAPLTLYAFSVLDVPKFLNIKILPVSFALQTKKSADPPDTTHNPNIQNPPLYAKTPCGVIEVNLAVPEIFSVMVTYFLVKFASQTTWDLRAENWQKIKIKNNDRNL